MYVTEAIRTSLAEILAHKLPSGLTLVGIVLGTTALVVMVSVIGGLALSVQQGLADLGFMRTYTDAPLLVRTDTGKRLRESDLTGAEPAANRFVVWDEATLTAYLPDPKAFVPKTKMAFAGLKKPEEIVDIIAFLKANP